VADLDRVGQQPALGWRGGRVERPDQPLFTLGGDHAVTVPKRGLAPENGPVSRPGRRSLTKDGVIDGT
jgi:hypothetical protein